MRHMGLKKRGMESNIIVLVIFMLFVLVVLIFFSGQISVWINKIIDKLFGW
jgi:hypothetical protein